MYKRSRSKGDDGGKKKRVRRTLESTIPTREAIASCLIFGLPMECFSAMLDKLDYGKHSGVQNGKLSFLDVINLDNTCTYFHFGLRLEYKFLWFRFFLPHAPTSSIPSRRTRWRCSCLLLTPRVACAFV